MCVNLAGPYAWVAEQWPAFPEYGEVGDVLSAH